jgi:hypothetical protein
MAVYRYGNNIKKVYRYGSLAVKVYRYGTLVFSTALTWAISAADALSEVRGMLAAASIESAGVAFAFGGSNNTTARLSSVDMISSLGVKSSATALRTAKYSAAAAALGNYAFVSGGSETGLVNSSETDRYSSDGTRTTCASSSLTLRDKAAARAGNYVLFAGGYRNAVYGAQDLVEAYDSDGIKTSCTGLGYNAYDLAGATYNDYAFFGTGYDESSQGNVAIYSPSLVRVYSGNILTARRYAAAARCGNGVIFAGGWYSNVVEHVTVDGIVTTFASLSSARGKLTANTLESGHVVICGGGSSASPYGETNIEVYHPLGFKVDPNISLTIRRSEHGTAVIGNKLIVMGGDTKAADTSKTQTDKVDIITLTIS